MLKSIITIVFICFSINIWAQNLGENEKACKFLKDLHFKNGVDTLTVKVRFKDISPLTSDGYLGDLRGKGIIKQKFNYQLAFEPEHCSKEYIAPSSANNINAILKRRSKSVSAQTILYITCVVFEKYRYDYEGTPYFVVIKIGRAN